MNEYTADKKSVSQPNTSALDTIHPGVLTLYFCIVLVLTMLCMQPVLLALSFFAAVTLSARLRGALITLKTLSWQLPLMLLCALVNPLFSVRGSTELFRIGDGAVFLESLVYGGCMAVMLAAVMMWFICVAHILSSDKIMAGLGKVFPTIALMVSMTLSLLPRLIARGKLIASSANIVQQARPKTFAGKLRKYQRVVSVLMAWSMEDSLDTADAMRARGYGAVSKRSSYQRYRFGAYDFVTLVALLIFAACAAVLAWTAYTQYSFFPSLSKLNLWWGYAVYGLFLCSPLIACLGDDLRWMWLDNNANMYEKDINVEDDPCKASGGIDQRSQGKSLSVEDDLCSRLSDETEF